jgi:hypothetical protein
MKTAAHLRRANNNKNGKGSKIEVQSLVVLGEMERYLCDEEEVPSREDGGGQGFHFQGDVDDWPSGELVAAFERAAREQVFCRFRIMFISQNFFYNKNDFYVTEKFFLPQK